MPFRLLFAILSGVLVAASNLPAASPLAGNGFGRATLSGGGASNLTGLAQQSIIGFRGSRGRIISVFIAADTPVALAINDRIEINGRRAIFVTNLNFDSGNDRKLRAIGHARVTPGLIMYSVRSRKERLGIQGTIRVIGETVIRTEVRRQRGQTFRFRLTIYR